MKDMDGAIDHRQSVLGYALNRRADIQSVDERHSILKVEVV